MAIRMRVNNNLKSKCENCRCEYKNTSEMYDLQICETKFVLCKMCIDELLHKTLKADCLFNGKTKSKEDLERIRRQQKYGRQSRQK